MLQKICINSKLSGRYHEEVINNRNHIVTTMRTIDCDSVMNDLFYPAGEVASSMGQLDHLPAPAGHPEINGDPVSAFHPLALNANHFGGFVRNPVLDGKKVTNELVIDVDIAGNSAQGRDIVGKIKSGARMGVSTGLNAKITNAAGEHGGKKFRGFVSDIKFDHVAVLLNELPAGDNTFTLNSSGVLFHNINETKTGSYIMDKLELDISNLSIEDRMRVSQLKLGDLMDAINHKVTVDEAKVIVQDAGLQVNSVKVDIVEDFLANQEAFNQFKAKLNADVEETKGFILKNSKMTDEQLSGLSIEALDSLSKSVAPINNHIAGAPGAGTEAIKLDLM